MNTFWHLPRLMALLARRAVQHRVLWSTALTLGAWVTVVVVCGPVAELRACGVALVVGFALIEPIMLSQHMHIPMRLAGDDDVAPLSPRAQVPYTRSLRFPEWISRFVLLRFDAHELHHAFPNVPGWQLRALDRPTENDVEAFSWIARGAPCQPTPFSSATVTGRASISEPSRPCVP